MDHIGTLSVSLVIPVFNEEALIRRCLLAAVHQTVAADEVIVVDNGSTDGTAAVVAKMQQEHPRKNIVLLQQNVEQGLVPTRNFGFDRATAEVLGRIDADSVLEPDWVEQAQRAFAAPDVAAVTGPVIYYDMPLNRLGHKTDDALRRLGIKMAPGQYPFLFGCNMAIRRSAWEQIRSETCRDVLDQMHEDIDLSLHLRERGLRIAYSSAMVSGVSARRLDDSPAEFRYYIDRFERTYRSHRMNGRALKAPAIILRSIYWPLKMLRTLNSSGTEGPGRDFEHGGPHGVEGQDVWVGENQGGQPVLEGRGGHDVPISVPRRRANRTS